MNKLVSVLLLGTALSLTACGGDSDSSGSTTSKTTSTDTTSPVTPKLFNASTDNACEINADTNEVYATNTGCNFAHPTMQNGTALKYTCVENSRVNGLQGGLNITAKTINLSVENQNVTILCKT